MCGRLNFETVFFLHNVPVVLLLVFSSLAHSVQYTSSEVIFKLASLASCSWESHVNEINFMLKFLC